MRRSPTSNGMSVLATSGLLRGRGRETKEARKMCAFRQDIPGIYIGFIISHYQDPAINQPISWNVTRVFFVNQLVILTRLKHIDVVKMGSSSPVS